MREFGGGSPHWNYPTLCLLLLPKQFGAIGGVGKLEELCRAPATVPGIGPQ